MIQRVIPGIETLVGYDESIILGDPINTINHFEEKEYQYLQDWNSGNLLLKRKINGPYIPDRVVLPSGIALDEVEIMEGLERTPLNDPKREELVNAFYYFTAIHVDDGSAEKHREWCFSFLDDADEVRTTIKYTAAPFYLEAA